VFYASQGYNVLIPDYLGNGSAANFPGTTKFPYHPYLHAQTEGSTLLDAIRASRGWLGARRVMFLGGSQGAHAVAAAYLLATQYPGEFDVRAAAFNGAPFDVPAEVAYAASQPALLPLYNKAMTAWATLYNGGWALSSAQRVAIARANDIAGIPSLTPSPSVQLCGTPYDTTVPFSYTTTMQTRLGGYAVPLLQVGASDLGTGTAAYPGLGGNAHAIAGTICIGRELAYFNARR